MGIDRKEWGCMSIIIYMLIGFLACAMFFWILPWLIWIVVGYLIWKYVIKSNDSSSSD